MLESIQNNVAKSVACGNYSVIILELIGTLFGKI